MTYLGTKEIAYSSICSLVGLHENYLNKAIQRYDQGLVSDIADFLNQPWAMLMFHDKFQNLKSTIQSLLRDKDEIHALEKKIVELSENGETELNRTFIIEHTKEISDEAKKMIEVEIVEFLKQNRNHMPYYYIPEIN